MNSFKAWLNLVGLLTIVYTSAEARTHTIATGQTTGTYYQVGQLLSEGNGSIEVVPTKGSVENLIGVVKGTYQFGIVQSDVVYYNLGIQDIKPFQVIGTLYYEPIYILVRSGLHLSGIDELRGKRVAVGLDNSGTQLTSKTILGMFKISLEELEPYKLTYDEIVSSFTKGEIDAAFIIILGIPERIESLIKNDKVYLLKISRSDLTRIASANPNLYTLLSVIDPQDINERFPTISLTSVLIAHPGVDEDIVHNLAKRLCDKSFRNSRSIEKCKQYWQSYPFVLYNRNVGKSGLIHKKAFDYYKSQNLVIKYRVASVARFWFPSLLCLSVASIFIHKRTRLKIKQNSWIWMSYALLAITVVGYFCLFFFESNIMNPDIEGSPIDLYRVFLLVFKAGEVFCVTSGGKAVRTGMLVASGVFVAAMTSRVAAYFVGQKILEVFKMNPMKKKLSEHVVICNWTSKIEGVIKELRSGIIDRRAIIVLTQPTSQTTNKLPDMPEYDDVYIIIGNPVDENYLQRTNIPAAHAVLILADVEHSNDPDALSLMTLLSLKKVVSVDNNIQKKPNVVVEVLNPVFIKHMYEAGANEVIAYSDITHKLLAQAIITPGAIGFVREILTATDDSNEIYILGIPKKYEGLTFEELSHKINNKHRTTSNPLTLVGIRSKGELYINPRNEQFTKVNAGDEAVVLAWIKPKNL